MDLSIPQHFTKEQSVWIKAYCIRRNLEFYNKAIDDFADKIISLCDDGEFINRFNEFTATTILELSEQLKEGARMRKTIPKSVRKQVYAKYNGHCAYCGCEIPFKGFNVDHLYCLRNYEYTEEFTGIDVHSIDNLMPACGSCNRYKATMDLETFRKQLQKIPDRLKRDVRTYNIAVRFGMVQESREPVKFYFEKVGGENEQSI